MLYFSRFSGATFGTGITAIKLTALGRPQLLVSQFQHTLIVESNTFTILPYFQLQFSEVIMQTRKYMEEIAGGTGNVLSHHKTIKDLEKYLGGMSEKQDVKDFLKKVTSDKDG
jgi:proline dehydrogenase